MKCRRRTNTTLTCKKVHSIIAEFVRRRNEFIVSLTFLFLAVRGSNILNLVFFILINC